MASVYEIVTEKITNLLENGTIPWRKPWEGGTGPQNAITHRLYNGLNVILLEATAMSKGYSENLWLTYRQAEEAGGHVKKGEHGTLVIFWKFTEAEDLETGKKKSIPMLRYFTVFNVTQCEGIKYTPPEPLPPIPASSVYDNMPHRPELKHAGASACYMPTSDTVYMPAAKFQTQDHYYAVLYHELGHSTGHASRLARFDATTDHTFGGEDYSKEELTAELCSAFVCAATGTNNENLTTNSAAYIKSWLGALKNDKTMIVYAAARAQKAADYMLGKLQQTEPEEG